MKWCTQTWKHKGDRTRDITFDNGWKLRIYSTRSSKTEGTAMQLHWLTLYDAKDILFASSSFWVGFTVFPALKREMAKQMAKLYAGAD